MWVVYVVCVARVCCMFRVGCVCVYVLRVCACRMCFAYGVFVLRALCMLSVSCVACAAFVLQMC